MWWTRNQLGTYKPTGEISQGAPVYKSTTTPLLHIHHVHLYRHSDCTWRTSEDDEHDDGDVYKSVGTAPCPTDIRQWQHINKDPDTFSHLAGW